MKKITLVLSFLICFSITAFAQIDRKEKTVFGKMCVYRIRAIFKRAKPKNGIKRTI
jgi:hypothetical protein